MARGVIPATNPESKPTGLHKSPQPSSQTKAASSDAPLFDASTQQRIVLAIILLATLNALIWSFVRVPGSGSPDERHHFGVVETLVTTKSLPVFEGYPPGHFSQGPVRAQVAYELTPNFISIPVAFTLGILRSQDYAFNVHMARLFMVALYPITLWFTFLTIRRVFPDSTMAPVWGVAAMSAVPMFTLVHTYYTNEAPAIAASTVATYALVRASQSGFNTRDTLLLGSSLAFVGLHKYTGFLMFPATMIVLTWHFFNKPMHLLRIAATAFGIAAAISSWWYIRNWTLYGDPFGVTFTQAAVDASGSAPIPPRARGLNPIEFASETSWLPENFATFWAGYGSQRLKLPGAAYLAFLAIVVTAAVGLVYRMTRSVYMRSISGDSPVLAIMAIIHIGLWTVSFWSSYTVDVALHGRYVFPTFLAFIILVIGGLSEFPRHFRISTLAAIITTPVMIAANGAYFLHSFLPDVYL